MSKGVHNIAFYVSPDPECSRTTQNSEISLAPSRGRILYAIYGNSTCVINHIVVTAIDKRYRNYYVSTASSSSFGSRNSSRVGGVLKMQFRAQSSEIDLVTSFSILLSCGIAVRAGRRILRPDWLVATHASFSIAVVAASVSFSASITALSAGCQSGSL